MAVEVSLELQCSGFESTPLGCCLLQILTRVLEGKVSTFKQINVKNCCFIDIGSLYELITRNGPKVIPECGEEPNTIAPAMVPHIFVSPLLVHFHCLISP
jgi:hypothetical protein